MAIFSVKIHAFKIAAMPTKQQMKNAMTVIVFQMMVVLALAYYNHIFTALFQLLTKAHALHAFQTAKHAHQHRLARNVEPVTITSPAITVATQLIVQSTKIVNHVRSLPAPNA